MFCDTRERAAVADAAVQATGGSYDTNAIPVPSTDPRRSHRQRDRDDDRARELRGGRHYDRMSTPHHALESLLRRGRRPASAPRTCVCRCIRRAKHAAHWAIIPRQAIEHEGVHQEAARAGCVCSAAARMVVWRWVGSLLTRCHCDDGEPRKRYMQAGSEHGCMYGGHQGEATSRAGD